VLSAALSAGPHFDGMNRIGAGLHGHRFVEDATIHTVSHNPDLVKQPRYIEPGIVPSTRTVCKELACSQARATEAQDESRH
jgi:hypothetical protein